MQEHIIYDDTHTQAYHLPGCCLFGFTFILVIFFSVAFEPFERQQFNKIIKFYRNKQKSYEIIDKKFV